MKMERMKKFIVEKRKGILMGMVASLTIAMVGGIIYYVSQTPTTVVADEIIEVETVAAEPQDTQELEIETETEEVEEVIEEVIEEEEVEEVIEEEEEEEEEEEVTINTANSYYIKINIQKQVVTVYSKDSDGNYTNPVIAFVCSTGSATPSSGVYTTSNKYRWHTLNGGVYGQYCTRITGGILFHSVPCSTYGVAGSVYAKYYDQLGTKASAGCVRLTVAAAKWIYENCASGTQVEFYSSSDAGPLTPASTIKISDAEGDLKYWDPTDPDPSNPWIAYFAAQAEEEEEEEEETPDTTEPDTTEPDTTEPDTTEPDTTEPDTTEPDTTEPDTTEPDTTEPDTTEPDTTEPDTTEPDTTEPDTTGA